MNFPLLLLIALFSLNAGCKKENEDQLPPATQTGAGTFGCKINGKVFVPQGYDGTGRPNPHVLYDVGVNGLPYLSINAGKFNSRTPAGYVFISYGDLVSNGLYQYPQNFNFSVGWPEVLGSCFTAAFDSTIKKNGGGTITKFDPNNHIVSGTFAFKFKTATCDTVYITDGRFDIKY